MYCANEAKGRDVRPLESTPDTQPQLHPPLLSLSAMISEGVRLAT